MKAESELSWVDKFLGDRLFNSETNSFAADDTGTAPSRAISLAVMLRL